MLDTVARQLRGFAKSISQPIPYRPVVTELKGVTNLALGVIALMAPCILKVVGHKKAGTELTNRHLTVAVSTLKLGAREFFPSFVVVLGLSLLWRNVKVISLEPWGV